MEGLPDRPSAAEQRNETLREIVARRQRPQRRAVAVHDDLLSFPQPVDQRPAGIARH